jgi:serine/threonine protein kinase
MCRPLKNQHILSIHEVYDFNDVFFVVTKHFDGFTLFDLINENKTLAEREVALVIRQLLLAI